MSERKVLNKYFPPDFDPTLIPRLRLGRERQYKVRLMAPFSMRCNTCGHWIGAHTKFNARKETVKNEKFHTMEIYRFYIRCPKCAAEITFKTDPENLDYVCENGASRNFEPWRGEQDANAEMQKAKEEEEEENPLKALENRTQESKREMEILDALDEIRTKNSTLERTTVEKAIQNMVSKKEQLINVELKKQDEQDELLIKSLFKDADGERIKRLNDSFEPEVDKKLKISFLKDPLSTNKAISKNNIHKKSALDKISKLGVIIKPKTTVSQQKPSSNSAIQPLTNTYQGNSISKNLSNSTPANDLNIDLSLSMVGDYSSDSSS
ncbi:Coiled-coil domain-containing protein 94-like protein [Smittium culicis]|uniref:Splicing factor YJU2 n=1 Tax=Smittium culicis TaxID=133412 RepID=A0A1R1YEC0_9FUNG|nr:Coiled-coil domain-containing protein 94-like protein [Smittium culicis]